MNIRLIPDFTAVVCVCVLAGSQTATAWADWTTKPSATGYYSDTGSYQTPPAGGWEDVLDQEIQQEKLRGETKTSEEPAETGTQTEEVTPPAAAQTLNDVQAEVKQLQQALQQSLQQQQKLEQQLQQQQTSSKYRNGKPGYRDTSHARHTSKSHSRDRYRDHGSSGFGMPWGGDRRSSGFDMPWGGDRRSSGVDMPWGGDHRGSGFDMPWGGDRGFNSPWGDDGYGFSGPWDNGYRGGRRGWYAPW